MTGELNIVWHLVRDKRVPIYTKAIPAAVLVYMILPIDLVPDVLPIVGQIDDLMLLILALRTFVWLAPNEVVNTYQQEMQTKLELLA